MQFDEFCRQANAVAEMRGEDTHQDRYPDRMLRRYFDNGLTPEQTDSAILRHTMGGTIRFRPSCWLA